MIENLLLIVHLVMAVSVVILVLLQQGKGAQAGAAFGGGSSGSSQSLFGARGSANFLTRTTAVIATIFFITTLSLAYLYANRSGSSSVVSDSVVEQIEEVQESDVPMVPADASEVEPDTQSDIPAVPE
jgi:preprotein translocase subunit SecG